jgi:heat shock protein HslJ
MQFSASPTTINSGQPVTFTWNVTGAQQVYFYILGQNYLNFPVPPQSSRVVYPPQTTIYELRALYQNNTTEVRQIQILVNPPPVGAPVISQFSIYPTDSIFIGSCVTINWRVDGQLTSVRLLRNQGVIWGSAPSSGSFQDCPPGVGTTVYSIEASGPGGTSVQQDSVDVLQQPATPVPTQPPVPQPPVIEYFYGDPTEVMVGQCIMLSWKAGGGTNYVQLIRQGQVILDSAPFTGQAQDCLQKQGQVVYELLARNPQGQSTNATVTVNVVAPPVTNPLPGSIWELVAFYDGVGAMVTSNPNVKTVLNFDNNTNFSGNAGCNNYNGIYSSSGTTIRFDPNISTTGMICDDFTMNQEAFFLALLPSSVRFEVVGSDLYLYNAANQLILQMRVPVTPY